MKLYNVQIRRSGEAGFNMIETLMGVAIVGIVFISLYTSLTSGLGVVKVLREDLRATQIMLEKVETIRLYNWDQLTDPSFIPDYFIASYFPDEEPEEEGSTFGGELVGLENLNNGIWYFGQLTISDPPLGESYNSDMKLITVRVSWFNGNIARNRDMLTYVSRYGLQNYIY